MKELDFDELDRAVSSLMTDLPANDSAISSVPVKDIRDEENVVELSNPSGKPIPSAVVSSSISQQKAPLASPVAEIPPLPKPEEPISLSAPAVRRSRQLMDIVRPARPTMSSAPAVSHQSTTEQSQVPNKTKDMIEEEPAPKVGPHDETISSEEKPSLSVIDSNKEVNSAQDSSCDEAASMGSPFLPDANEKVEKRPLGGLKEGNNITNDPIVADENDEKSGNKDDSIRPLLPVELSHEIIAVEAGHTEITESTPQVSIPPALHASGGTVQSINMPASSPAQKTVNDNDVVSVYDTSVYHQPLAHPPKKKSGWLTVLLIILLLGISGGAGAAYYYFTTIH